MNCVDISNKNNFLIIGKKQSGKTNLIKNIIYHLNKTKKIQNGIVITPQTYEYDENISLFSFTEFNSQIPKLIIEKQEQDNKQHNTLLILDDCIYDYLWVDSLECNLLFTSNNKLKINIIMAIQYPLSLPKIIDNFDYIFIFGENNCNNRKRIYDNYCKNNFTSFEEFNSAIEQLLKYECLLIDYKNNKVFIHKIKLEI